MAPAPPSPWPGTGRLIGRFLVSCMVIGFGSLLAAGIAAAWVTYRTNDHNHWIEHTYQVALAIAEVRTNIEQDETVRRGYVIAHQPVYRDAYQKERAAVPQGIDRIAALTRDNPAQQANIARLRREAAALTAVRDRSITLIDQRRFEDAAATFRIETAAQRMRSIRDLLTQMDRTERALLAKRAAAQKASVRAFYVTLAVAGVLLAFVALSSLLAVLRYTRDLARSHAALRAFSESLEEQVAERTADLTRANAEIQRFAYIVSHDLRSPLVNVMGFTAELDDATASLRTLVDEAQQAAPQIVTPEARAAAYEDLPEAIGFIRTSTQKMDRLINAILKLSREGRRVITPQLIDMTALVATAQAAIQHLFDERGATFTLGGALPGIVSDRLALEQIMSNLIENAVKYLDPARPGRIVVSGERAGDRIRYSVEDNGRGIAASDQERVFDLFRRAGAQDQPGEGIGLAQVRALAYRLGGTVTLQSAPGRGTTFTLSLPATFADAQEAHA